MTEEKIDTRWYRFMKEDWWVVTMNIVRILSLIIVVLAVAYMIKEVESIKLLSGDVCKICAEKTGATCYNFALP